MRKSRIYLKRLVLFLVGIFILFGVYLILTSSGQRIQNENQNKQEYSYFVKSYMYHELDDKLKDDINSCSKEGYVVESCNGAGSNPIWLLIMKKKIK